VLHDNAVCVITIVLYAYTIQITNYYVLLASERQCHQSAGLQRSQRRLQPVRDDEWMLIMHLGSQSTAAG
jgi:hypothetical protein